MSESSASQTTSYKPQPPPTTLKHSELGTAFLAIMGGAGATTLGVATAPVGLGIAVVGVGYAAASWYRRKTETDQSFRKANEDAAKLFNKQRDLQNKLMSSESAKECQILRDQIDQVQQEHIRFTTWLADNDLDLPLPPQQMGEEEYNKTQANWRKLCAGDGQISIPNNAPPGFKADMRAMHASLLSSSSGRSLLDQILNPKDPKDPIQIRPTKPDPCTTPKQRSDRVRDRENLLPKKAAELQQLRNQSTAVDEKRLALIDQRNELKKQGKALSEEDQKSLAQLNEQLEALDKDIDSIGTELGKAGRWEPPPPGLADPAGKVLTLRQGLRDSEFICYGEDGAGILTPAFLIYGHELVHCARRRAGITSEVDLGKTGLDKRWGNLEEYGTIHGDEEGKKKLGGLCENKLRDDYKLPSRKYVTSKTREEVEMEKEKEEKKEEKKAL